MVVIGYSSTPAMFLFGGVLAAVGFGSSQPTIQTMTLLSETPLRRGVATNTMYMGTDLGLFLGPLFGGLVYAGSDYSVMYVSGSIPIVLSVVCLVIAFPIHKRRLAEMKSY